MSRRHRVLVFAHSPGLSGAERSLLETLEILAAHHDIFLVAPGPGPFLEKARSLPLAAIHVIPQHLFYEKRGYSPVKAATKALVNLWGVCRCWWLARRIRPTLIYSNSVATWTGALVSRLSDCPHVWHLRELIQDSSIGSPVFGRRLERALLTRAATCFLCNSAFVRGWYEEHFGITPAVAYQPVQVPETIRTICDKKDRTDIAVFGRLQHEKRQHVVVEAIAKLPATARQRVVVHLYGSGSAGYLARLQEIITRFGLQEQVRIEGFTSQAHQMMRDSDLVVVPSVEEPFGRVAAEAMLLGVPVIGASSGGTLELIGKDGRRGALFPADDADAAASLIADFMRDPEPFVARAHTAQAWAHQALSRDAYSEAVQSTFATAKG